MCSGSKPENQETGRGIAKRGNRFTPVFLVEIRFAPDHRDLFSMLDQPRTQTALGNRTVQFDK
jgi:hypothetical protein